MNRVEEYFGFPETKEQTQQMFLVKATTCEILPICLQSVNLYVDNMTRDASTKSGTSICKD